MAVTPKLGLELFAPLGVGWREDATAGAIIDYNMMLIDAASGGGGGGSVTSVFGRTGVIIAQAGDYLFSQIGGTLGHSQLPTLVSGDIPNNAANTSGSAASISTAFAPNTVMAGPASGGASAAPTARALVQSDLPSMFDMYANLPNVKLVPVFSSFAGIGAFDFYTVPAGRRAVLSNITFSNQFLNQPNSQGEQTFLPLLKVSGAYYVLGTVLGTGNNAGLTSVSATPPPYIAEAGEGFSLIPSYGGSILASAASYTSVANSSTTTLTLTAVGAQTNGLATYTGTITGGSTNALAGLTITIAGFTNTSNNGSFLCVGSSTTTLLLQNTNSIAETHAGTAAFGIAVYSSSTNLATQQAHVGKFFTVTGFSNSANNGTFMCTTAANSGFSTLANPNAVAETPAIAASMQLIASCNINAWIVEFDNTASLKSSKLISTGLAASTTPYVLYTPSGSKNGLMVGTSFVGNLATTGSIFGTGGINGGGSANYYLQHAGTQSSSLTQASASANGLTTYLGNVVYGGGPSSPIIASTFLGPFTLTSVAAASGGTTVYTGTITGGASTFAGATVTITGFTNSANNGTFFVAGMTSTTITLRNTAGIAETHSGTATMLAMVYTGTFTGTGNQVYAGMYVQVTGMTNSANNGTFLCLAGGNSTTVVLANSGGATSSAQVGIGTLQPLYGASVTITGFNNAGNNGTFTVVSSTPYSLVLSNSGGVGETHAGTATFTPPVVNPNAYLNTQLLNGPVYTALAGGYNTTIANGDSLLCMLTPASTAVPPLNGFGTVLWVNVVEF